MGEVRAVGLDSELVDTGGEVLHVELVDDLVEVGVVRGANVDYFPVEGAGELAEALKGDVKAEGVEDLPGVVPNLNVVDVNLSHLARYLLI